MISETDGLRAECGLLLVGHGTRNPQGREEFLTVASQLQGLLPDCQVEACFLELAEPGIAQAVERLQRRGCGHIVSLPLLLFAAGHAKTDIPHAVEAALQGEKHLQVVHAPPLECSPAIVELAALRYEQAVGSQNEFIGPNETILFLVGRGNKDREAQASMSRFAKLLRQRINVAQLQTCYYAMAQPDVRDVLQQAVTSNFQRIVVQPHLLFQGDILSKLQEIVTEISGADPLPDRQWVVSGHLGPHLLLVEGLRDIAKAYI